MMMQVGFKIFDWDESTRKACFYRQGDLILSLTLSSYEEAQTIYTALEKTYTAGVEDGYTWIIESVEDKKRLM